MSMGCGARRILRSSKTEKETLKHENWSQDFVGCVKSCGGKKGVVCLVPVALHGYQVHEVSRSGIFARIAGSWETLHLPPLSDLKKK